MIQVCVRPEDVKKVRGLILSLAISGKLTSKEVSSEDISGTFIIPSDWKWCTLSEIAACRGSAKAGSDGIKPSDWILDMEDIDGATGTVHTRATFKERSSLSTKSAFKPGDVLYGKLRPYLNKVVLADSPGFCTTEIIPITPGATIESRYLQLVLRSPYFLTYVAKRSYGMKMPRLGTKDLESARIPRPPLAEQKRIVAKVDELMALCDRLEAQLKERDVKQAALAKAALAKFTENPTPENLQLLFHPSFTIEPGDLRALVLEFAIRGKLIPQDKSDEPAAELLARIIDKSAKGNSKKSKNGEVHNEIVGDFPIPQNWIWSELGKVFDVRDGTHDTPAYTAKGFPLITSKNIYGGSLSFEGAKLISKEDHLHISERSKVAQGDILFAMIGSIGNPVIVNTDIDFSIKNLALFKYHSRVDSEPRFLLLYLRLVEKAMKAEAAGGVQSFVSLGYLRKYRFPLPPLSEQERIASRVETLFAQIDNLEAQLESSRTTGEKLLEAMVAELTES